MGSFKIPVMPKSTSKTIRFPNDVIEEIEKEITGTDCSFSAFVVEASRNALKELKEND